MGKSSVLTIRVPSDLKHRIDLLASEQGVSINQLAMYMFAKEIGHLESSKQLSKYWEGRTKKEIEQDFDEVITKIKSRPVPGSDKIKSN